MEHTSAGPPSRRRLLTGAAALAASVVLPGSPLRPGTATAGQLWDPRTRINAEIRRIAGSNLATIGIGVYDRRTRVAMTVNGGLVGETGSVSKVLVVAAAIRAARARGGFLTADQQDLAHRAITRSDNASASTLWSQAGGWPAVAATARAMGLPVTAGARTPAHWGWVLTTPYEAMLIAHRLAYGTPALLDGDRRWVLGTMAQVVGTQRWGVGHVERGGVTAQLKNGWMWLDSAYGWRVNSVGHVTGWGRDYTLGILQRRNATQTIGISRCNQLSTAVFDALYYPLR